MNSASLCQFFTKFLMFLADLSTTCPGYFLTFLMGMWYNTVYRNSKEVISRRIASNCCRFLLGYQWVHIKHIQETQETTCHIMFISLTSAYILLHMRACSYQYALLRVLKNQPEIRHLFEYHGRFNAALLISPNSPHCSSSYIYLCTNHLLIDQQKSPAIICHLPSQDQQLLRVSIVSCVAVIQWNLRIIDTLGPGILSFIGRWSSL